MSKMYQNQGGQLVRLGGAALKAGAAATATNDATVNGNGYIKTVEDDDVIAALRIQGSDGIAVTTSASGEITISGSGSGSAKVVGTPTVTGAYSAIIGGSLTLEFSATALLAGASIASFNYTVDGGEAVTVQAADNEATATIAIASTYDDGDTIDIVVTAKDNYENVSQAATKTIGLVRAYVNQPTATPSSTSTYPNVAFNIAASAFVTTGDTDTLAEVEYGVFASNSTSGTRLWSNTGSTGLSATVPAGTLAPGTYFVGCRERGTNLGWSDWSNLVAVTVNAAFVDAPVISSPSANAEIVKAGLTVTLNAFSATGGTDTQASVQVDICSDSAGSSVVATKTETGTGVTVTFSESELSALTVGSTYYLCAYRTGETLGKSAKSSSVAFKPINGITGNAGALLYKNSNNTGIVMEWLGLDNTKKKVVIAKAGARPGKAQWHTANTDYGMTKFSSANADGGWYAHGTTSPGTKEEMTIITNAEFRRLWANLASDGTCKANTTTMVGKGSPAATAARGVSIDGIACDLPNEETLIMVYLNAPFIDALDDSAASNSTWALDKNCNPNGRFCFDGCGDAWSCTEYNANGARAVNYYGSCRINNKTGQYAVLPVREL